MLYHTNIVRPRKKSLFVSCNRLKKNKVRRLVKKIFLQYFFDQKYVFYACFTLIGTWEGRRKFRVGIFLNKNLLGRVTGNKQLFSGLTEVPIKEPAYS